MSWRVNPKKYPLEVSFADDSRTMVWAASLDDKSGTAASVLGGVTGRKDLSLASLSSSTDPITSCVFSECGFGDK